MSGITVWEFCVLLGNSKWFWIPASFVSGWSICVDKEDLITSWLMDGTFIFCIWRGGFCSVWIDVSCLSDITVWEFCVFLGNSKWFWIPASFVSVWSVCEENIFCLTLWLKTLARDFLVLEKSFKFAVRLWLAFLMDNVDLLYLSAIFFSIIFISFFISSWVFLLSMLCKNTFLLISCASS